MSRKIAFILPDFHGGGVQKMVLNMTAEYVARGYHVDLIVLRDAGPFRDTVPASVNVVYLNVSRALFSCWRLRRYFTKKCPDIVISAMTYMNVVVILSTLGLGPRRPRLIVTERNHMSSAIGSESPDKKRLLLYLAKTLYPFADFVVGISKGVIDNVVSELGLERSKTTWIYNPVVTKPMVEAAQQNSGAPEDVTLSRESPQELILITSGRLNVQKDYPTLLKSLQRINEMRKARLYILGEGELKDTLQTLAADLGVSERVRFLGFLQNPLSVMSQADMFIISSRWEGFCNVIVEALLCGLPVAATDCPSGPSEILEDGKYGALSPVGDAVALADNVLKLASNTPSLDAQRKRAMDFTVAHICDQYEALFDTSVKETGYK